MAIVATYKFGKATVEIDDSCIKYTTAEEIQGVVNRIGQISYQSDLRKQMAEQQTKTEVG